MGREGRFCTTYFSWRWVFAGEVVIAAAILLLSRRISDAPVEKQPRLDWVGSVLSATGLALFVFGVLRSAEWGWLLPKEGGPSWGGMSPSIWLMLAGLLVIWIFFRWEARVAGRGGEPLIRPVMLRNRQLTGGLTMFFFQCLVQGGFFFVVPLFLSVSLGLTALQTGVKLLPLSVTLILAAIGIPKLFPDISPRLVVRTGLLLLLAGTVVLLGCLDANAGAEIVTVPLILIGLGMGALASQLGSVTVSAVSAEEAPEVGGIQNTVTTAHPRAARTRSLSGVSRALLRSAAQGRSARELNWRPTGSHRCPAIEAAFTATIAPNYDRDTRRLTSRGGSATTSVSSPVMRSV